VLDHDRPADILAHLHDRWGVRLELSERAGNSWVRVAAAGDDPGPDAPERRIDIRPDLCLMVHGDLPREAERVVQAAGGQCAAALDRDRLRTQAAQAEALAAGNRMRTALLAAVSHDLRTPLASLKASVSSLRQDDVSWSDADEAALLETIEDSTDRLTELIANLLDMSRVQTGALQPFLRPAALEEIVPVALTGLPDANVVDLDIPEDLPLALTDPGLLERALANLVSNAVRHSPAGRPPRVAAHSEGGQIVITVVDVGPGVPAQDRERIFEPFQRLGDQSPGTGIGLGLAVARGFIESVGGTIRAGKTPGGGLTMTVRVPATQTSAPAPLS
jgi:two-component system, OmpR family, sensor histidine kinase KdpD